MRPACLFNTRSKSDVHWTSKKTGNLHLRCVAFREGCMLGCVSVLGQVCRQFGIQQTFPLFLSIDHYSFSTWWESWKRGLTLDRAPCSLFLIPWVLLMQVPRLWSRSMLNVTLNHCLSNGENLPCDYRRDFSLAWLLLRHFLAVSFVREWVGRDVIEDCPHDLSYSIQSRYSSALIHPSRWPNVLGIRTTFDQVIYRLYP